ncbi:hypothetical protein HMPREF0813_00848 [Streptococcus anginosus F0211]|uniref:Uncharacterized protein n=1 Tax=Streptococcus anginosus F0211 TaxID=706437 RepID=E6J0S5_STRAP|nr:hypothetical protein HMPREF0813_00848 [Streptococcus anginosus F0211]
MLTTDRKNNYEKSRRRTTTMIESSHDAGSSPCFSHFAMKKR